jgi:hypothetical protein
MWNLVSVYLETVLILLQDRRTVCTERIRGSKSFWTNQMELLRDVESHFSPFGDVVSVSAR